MPQAPRFRTLSRAVLAGALLTLPVLGPMACGGGSDGGGGTITTPPPPTKTMSATAAQYLNNGISFINRYFYYRSRIDTAALRARANARGNAVGAQRFSDTYPALDTATRELGDPHSFFYKPTETLGNREDPSGPLYTPIASQIAPRIGYLWLTSFGGKSPSGRVDTLQRLIAKVDTSASICGWIIDQRANVGGFWPVMLSGIQPLLTPGRVGGFREGDGTSYYYFANTRGSGLIDKTERPPNDSAVFLTLPQSYTLRNPNPPVAILQGRYTASAGEIVVMAFKDPTRAIRTFGEDTYGVTTQPYTYTLPDTASIQITAALMFDRQGKDYGGGAIPADQPVAGPAINSSFQPGTRDAVVDAAIAWLNQQTGCKATTAGLSASRAGLAPQGGWQANAPGAPTTPWPAGKPTPWTATRLH